MQFQSFTLLKRFQNKVCLLTKLFYLRLIVAVYIPVAETVKNRQLNFVDEPVYNGVFHRHIAKNESPTRAQAAFNTLKKILRVRVVVYALRTDDDIETVVVEG